MELKGFLQRQIKSVGEEKADDVFKTIALELMTKYAIKAKNIYSLIEIEFYLYKEGVHQDTAVYPRFSHAGDFFYHYSGIDISFETDIEIMTFGGILIRSLKNIDTGEIIAGPLRCKDELLNEGVLPQIIMHKVDVVKIDKTTRQGISKGGKENNEYRFYVPQDNDWKRTNIRCIKYVVEAKEKTAVISETQTFYYPSYPGKSQDLTKDKINPNQQ